jgi:glucose/arabinose dehydrogenase
VTHAGDGSGRLFVVEQAGRIRIVESGAVLEPPFLDLKNLVKSGGERGLLGLAFHPDFATNRRFFVDYTREPDGATVIAEHHAGTDSANRADPLGRVLLTVAQPFSNHNGGMLAFGPDGDLYIGLGDGGSGGDPGNRAQNPNELLGKILRIDVDGARPYAIPPLNPFANGGGRPEIYALGLRNPWRFAFDRADGRLLAGDVGQNRVEEVDVIARGGNYGWPILEGRAATGRRPAVTRPG